VSYDWTFNVTLQFEDKVIWQENDWAPLWKNDDCGAICLTSIWVSYCCNAHEGYSSERQKNV